MKHLIPGTVRKKMPPVLSTGTTCNMAKIVADIFKAALYSKGAFLF
jgi:hypothetical protein